MLLRVVARYQLNFISKGLAFIFYGSQLAKTPSEISNYSTIIWLNGGPGSSSQTGNFLELGPIRINADGS